MFDFTVRFTPKMFGTVFFVLVDFLNERSPPFTTKTKTLLLLPGESLPSCTTKLSMTHDYYEDLLYGVPRECY